MYCSKCGQPVDAEDVNVQALVAKCRACGEVFTFDSRALRGSEPPYIRPEVPKPATIREEETVEGPQLIMRWFRASVLMMVVFCAIWDGFLYLWYSQAFQQTTRLAHAKSSIHNVPELKSPELLIFLFPSLHVMIGAGLTYVTIASLFNRTKIRVGIDGLKVRSGPIPWRNPPLLPREAIKQIYASRRVRSGRYGVSYTYRVDAVRSNGTREALLTGISDPDEARFIERWIEQQLGLPDKPVVGELL